MNERKVFVFSREKSTGFFILEKIERQEPSLASSVTFGTTTFRAGVRVRVIGVGVGLAFFLFHAKNQIGFLILEKK